MKLFNIGMNLAFVALISACASPKHVERVSESAVTDISDQWNDTDSRLVADEMVRDCLSRPWLQRVTKSQSGKPPVVIVQTVRNKSQEHIPSQTFTKDLERALINDGRVEFVASRVEREEIREERVDMATNASDETVKSPGKETGADYVLQGWINTIFAENEGDTQVKFYQINLELISLSDNRKVWVGDKKIKKVITRNSSKW